MEKKLTHQNEQGEVRMVDVSAKVPLLRTAKAEGKIAMKKETIELLKRDGLPKGDALACARIAGIMAAKKTSEWIPLCHQVALSKVEIRFEILTEAIRIESEVSCVDKTGIEMEALTAVCASALTLYDMAKAVDKQMKISEIVLLEKIKLPISL
jgi:cyclic pyranopterin phosphate synthase